MAKDRVSIFVANIRECILSFENQPSLVRNHNGYFTKRQESKKDAKDKHRISKYTYGSMSCNVGSLFVEFLKFAPERGDLLLSFSVSELYFADNGIPKSVIDGEDLAFMILRELKGIVDISQIPLWTTWKVTRDETNLDIIDTEENNKRRLDIVSRSELPYKKINNQWMKDGTVYFQGKGGVNSSSKSILYDKVREMENRGKNPYETLGIILGQGCLRLEGKSRKSPLIRLGDKTKLALGIPQNSIVPHLVLIMSEEFQYNTMMETIRNLHFDKIIGTRMTLLKAIKSSGTFSKRQLRYAIRVVNQLNGYTHDCKLSKKTINAYKKKILALGYHFMYSDVELMPITEEMVRKAVSMDHSQIRF